MRQAAERIMRAERLSIAALQQRLAAEVGADVPRSTLTAWRRSLDLNPVNGAAPTIAVQAETALRLTSSELKRLERQKTPDLDRLAKLAQIWKAIDSLSNRAPKVKARTLADLSGPTEGPNDPD